MSNIYFSEKEMSLEEMKIKLIKKGYTKAQQGSTFVDFDCEVCGKRSTLSIKVFLKRDRIICRRCKQTASLRDHIEGCKEEWVDRWKGAVRDKYGVDNIAFDETTQERKKETCIKKYGKEYAVEADCVRNKIKETFQKKYQGDSPFCSNLVQQKCQDTQRRRHDGKLFIRTEEFQEKRREACRKKFGRDYAGGTPEYTAKRHKTNIEKYGLRETFSCERLKEKRKKTMIERYGVEYAMQNPEKRQQILQTRYDTTGRMYPVMKGYRYDDKNFDSSYELAYYIWLKANKKDFIYHPGITLSYVGSDQKEHVCLPDFLVEGKFVEIKGDHFFNDKGEPWDPYQKEFWWEKYNALVNNNVRILKSSDLKEAFSYVKDNYGKNFLRECKSKYNNSKA